MKSASTLLTALSACALLAACAAPPPHAAHPAYLRAISDLRDARWNLAHRPGDAAVSGQEDLAITEIDRAINEARRAAADNGQNPNYRPPADANLNRAGRLHRADELLRQARNDAAREEDNPGNRGLRNDVVGHIDAAIRATDEAIRDVGMRR